MSMITHTRRWLAGVLLGTLVAAANADYVDVDEDDVDTVLSAGEVDVDRLRGLGPDVMPVLADIYRRSGADKRARIAWVFYQLGWRSPEAEAALMADVQTTDKRLRLQVQWALGRVSDAPEVVDVLLANMRHDVDPLFRDKAACALAYDQIHLSEQQKLRIYEGLVESLDSDNPQVRDISMKALRIHTGQTKGFRPRAPAAERAASIRKWQAWLDEYRSNL